MGQRPCRSPGRHHPEPADDLRGGRGLRKEGADPAGEVGHDERRHVRSGIGELLVDLQREARHLSALAESRFPTRCCPLAPTGPRDYTLNDSGSLADTIAMAARNAATLYRDQTIDHPEDDGRWFRMTVQPDGGISSRDTPIQPPYRQAFAALSKVNEVQGVHLRDAATVIGESIWTGCESAARLAAQKFPPAQRDQARGTLLAMLAQHPYASAGVVADLQALAAAKDRARG